MSRCSVVRASTLILANSCEMLLSARRKSFDFKRGDQNMAGSDLRFAEKQRRVMPAAIEHIDHVVGDARHIGFVLAKAVDDAGQIGHQTVRDRACNDRR